VHSAGGLIPQRGRGPPPGSPAVDGADRIVGGWFRRWGPDRCRTGPRLPTCRRCPPPPHQRVASAWTTTTPCRPPRWATLRAQRCSERVVNRSTDRCSTPGWRSTRPFPSRAPWLTPRGTSGSLTTPMVPRAPGGVRTADWDWVVVDAVGGDGDGVTVTNHSRVSTISAEPVGSPTQSRGRSMRASHRPGASTSAGVGRLRGSSHSREIASAPARSATPSTNRRPRS